MLIYYNKKSWLKSSFMMESRLSPRSIWLVDFLKDVVAHEGSIVVT